MTLPVFHLPSAAELAVGDAAALSGAEGHHASTVRRLRVGERVVVTDGRGASAMAVVSAVSRGEVTLVAERVEQAERPTPALTVVQAIPKGDRGERAVEMLTEVGVDAIVPWQAERCVSEWRGDKRERGRAKWESVAGEAAKQSRRTWWPAVEPVVSTPDLVERVATAPWVCVLHEMASASLVTELHVLESAGVPEQMLVVVGPEGGVSDRELEQLTSAGAVTASLGPTVMRTSTAGVAAASVVLAATGRWLPKVDPATEGGEQ